MKTEETGTKIRLDKWLWHARFFKTRSLASKVCKAGKVRINGQHAGKASVTVKAGDVLTFVQAETVKVIEIKELGVRRGPAPEAQMLYKDLSPAPIPKEETQIKSGSGHRPYGAGRPTKAERRATDKLMGRD